MDRYQPQRKVLKLYKLVAFNSFVINTVTLSALTFPSCHDWCWLLAVTLFELTVVNNWFIIMEGYASAASGWSRIYFMTFYILTMVSTALYMSTMVG